MKSKNKYLRLVVLKFTPPGLICISIKRKTRFKFTHYFYVQKVKTENNLTSKTLQRMTSNIKTSLLHSVIPSTSQHTPVSNKRGSWKIRWVRTSIICCSKGCRGENFAFYWSDLFLIALYQHPPPFWFHYHNLTCTSFDTILKLILACD